MKLLILAMSCDLPFYLKQEELVKNTWAKDVIENKYPEAQLYFIKVDKNERIEGNYLYINSDDSFYGTFNKNIRTFEFLEEQNIKYDFILRTNLSTYINVPGVINFLKNYTIQKLKSVDVYGGEYISSKLLTSSFRGNFVIFNRNHISQLVKHKEVFNELLNKENQLTTDDNVFGYILNTKTNSNFVKIKFKTFYQYTWLYPEFLIAKDENDLSNDLLYVSYRYYSPSNKKATDKDQDMSEYKKREEIEFPLCQKVHNFFVNHPYNIENPQEHLANY